jgi:alpha-L-glutamate ligase-like protein
VNVLRALWREGVMGINRRNSHYTLRYNPRRLYPTVDDKLATKRLCQEAGIPVPALYTAAHHHFELPALLSALSQLDSFVLKPARGAKGNGILVIVAQKGGVFIRSGGRRVGRDDLRYHAASIISGLYALGGHVDVAMVEERLEVHPALARITIEGVPDVRVIVYRGVPVMSMTRLPTRRSDGRANLHQGAVGAGVDLVDGRLLRAVQGASLVERHPDTGERLPGTLIPDFPRVLEIAVRAADCTGLGYVGADVVVDERRGPVILELNARPGLAIQLANGAGLLPRLRAVDRELRPGLGLGERLALGRDIASRRSGSEAQ